MNKKLNGFNNGRDITDGIGGNPSPLKKDMSKCNHLWSNSGITLQGKPLKVCSKCRKTTIFELSKNSS